MKINNINVPNTFDFSFMKDTHNPSNVYDQIVNQIRNKEDINNFISEANNQQNIKEIYNEIKDNNPYIMDWNVKAFCYTLNKIRLAGGWNKWVDYYHNEHIM
mgnify:CR=1 FL=1